MSAITNTKNYSSYYDYLSRMKQMIKSNQSKSNNDQNNTNQNQPIDVNNASINGEKIKSQYEFDQASECETCASRTYQDGSDDSGVSFQTPTQIDPKVAESAVKAHEGEHVAREQSKAKMEERRVISQSVSIHRAICPECGTNYVSGGTTTTTTASIKKAYNVGNNEASNLSAVA